MWLEEEARHQYCGYTSWSVLHRLWYYNDTVTGIFWLHFCTWGGGGDVSSSIFFTAFVFQGHEGGEAYPSCHLVQGRVLTQQVTRLSHAETIHTLTHSHIQAIQRDWSTWSVCFWTVGGSLVPVESPRMQKEKMKNPRCQAGVSNQERVRQQCYLLYTWMN